MVDYVGGTLVECNTAYDGQRETTTAHKALMKYHGWTDMFEVDIMDAHGPDLELAIPNGKKIKKNHVGKNIQNYDLIVSNATLQWIENFEPLVKKLETLLNPNGELIFSTFGKENFREIYHLLGTSLNYYSEKELKDLFKTSTITPEIHIMAFSEPKEVLRHLQLTGVNAIEQKSWTKKDLIKFENGYKNICSKRPTLTYNPIYIHTIK